MVIAGLKEGVLDEGFEGVGYYPCAGELKSMSGLVGRQVADPSISLRLCT